MKRKGGYGRARQRRDCNWSYPAFSSSSLFPSLSAFSLCSTSSHPVAFCNTFPLYLCLQSPFLPHIFPVSFLSFVQVISFLAQHPSIDYFAPSFIPTLSHFLVSLYSSLLNFLVIIPVFYSSFSSLAPDLFLIFYPSFSHIYTFAKSLFPLPPFFHSFI